MVIIRLVICLHIFRNPFSFTLLYDCMYHLARVQIYEKHLNNNQNTTQFCNKASSF